MKPNGRIFVMLIGTLENVPQMRVNNVGQNVAIGSFCVHGQADRYFRMIFTDAHAERIATIGQRGMWLDVHGWIVSREGKDVMVERFRVMTREGG